VFGGFLLAEIALTRRVGKNPSGLQVELAAVIGVLAC